VEVSGHGEMLYTFPRILTPRRLKDEVERKLREKDALNSARYDT
jgi:hypothetical protein